MRNGGCREGLFGHLRRRNDQNESIQRDEVRHEEKGNTDVIKKCKC